MKTRQCRHFAYALALAFLALSTKQSAAAGPVPPSAFFLTQLVLDTEKGVDAEVPPPQYGYLSASIGAFTLDGRVGHATFRWNHHLEVDWHDHDLKYIGEERDVQGNRFWVYAASINHDGHDDEIKLFFAQRQIQSDEGYRIFFSHGADEHDTHLLCIDANRLPYHKRP